MKNFGITLPTLITLLRIILIPFIIGAMIANNWPTAFWLFVVAAATDTIDGQLARWLGQQSLLGAMLDPIADKLLVLSCFFTFAFIQSSLVVIPAWFFWIVFIKELLLLGGAYVLYRAGSLEVAPSWLGKFTMFMQIIFITWLLSCHLFNWFSVSVYYGMLVAVIALAVASLVHYLVLGLTMLRKQA